VKCGGGVVVTLLRYSLTRYKSNSNKNNNNNNNNNNTVSSNGGMQGTGLSPPQTLFPASAEDTQYCSLFSSIFFTAPVINQYTARASKY
jgi:hypothetical protein